MRLPAYLMLLATINMCTMFIVGSVDDTGVFWIVPMILTLWYMYGAWRALGNKEMKKREV